MRPLLLAAALSALTACQSSVADKVASRRLQALTSSLELANRQTERANWRFREELDRAAAYGHFNRTDPVLVRLLVNCDTIQAGAARLRARIRASHRQLSALATRRSTTVLPPTAYAASQLFGQWLAYRTTLRVMDTRLVLPRLEPIRADTSAVGLVDSYFGDATPIEALADLVQLDTDVLAAESAALQEQSSKLIFENVVFDSTGAQASPDSATVVAGAEYHASLFLSNILKPPGLTMTVNGQAIAVGPAGIGRVRFVADPRLLGNRQQVTAYWVGEIRTSNPHRQSGDTAYRVRVPYRIVRGK